MAFDATRTPRPDQPEHAAFKAKLDAAFCAAASGAGAVYAARLFADAEEAVTWRNEIAGAALRAKYLESLRLLEEAVAKLREAMPFLPGEVE